MERCVAEVGVLGGGQLERLRRGGGRHEREQVRALDLGAGVGRVSRGLLLHLADEVDMCDGCAKFVAQAEQQLGGARTGARGRMGRFICSDLQSFVPDARRYDLIWMQWCVGYLTDEHLSRLLRDCGRALAPEGLLVIKDNVFERARPVSYTHLTLPTICSV